VELQVLNGHRAFDDTLDLNVRGTLFTVQKAPPLFVDGGSIFLNGSISNIKGFPRSSVYSARKEQTPARLIRSG
jgi:NAD(P)-dependent dehydrogenase (short-subunit alcohol dehydrogenase family)